MAAHLIPVNSRNRRNRITLRQRNERGMTTAEYAMGTLAAAGIGGVLLKIVTSPEFQQLVVSLLDWIVSLIKNMGAA